MAITKDLKDVISTFSAEYSKTPKLLKVIDIYIAFALATGLIQLLYMALVGSFPFNSFLAGFLSCVGTAVLAVCLRMQVNKENKEFKDLPIERAYADWLVANVVLHLVVINFVG